jgi:RNA polymerase sigma-70 factor (ECF subfamily)
MTVKEYNFCVREYSDNIYRFVLKHIRNEALAEDVIQDVFEKVWLKVGDVTFEKAKSYLFQAAYNRMIDVIRKETRQARWKEESEAKVVYQPQVDAKQVIDQALERLPEIQQSVILLRDYEGYSYEEIGEILELNESQVKVYIFRARKTLKQYLSRLELIV